MPSARQILAAIVGAAREGKSLPELVCVDCAASMDVTGAGIALMNDDGHQGLVGASDRTAARMEELQFELGEGPCVEASRLNRAVLTPDLSTTTHGRWPGFSSAAQEAGIGAVFAFPLQLGAIRLGVFDLYRATPGDLEPGQLSTALAYADTALVVLLHLQNQMRPGDRLHPQLGDPLENRAEIHQATGALSVRASIGLADALLLMRAHAFASGLPLLQVARDVLAGTLHLGPEEDDHE